MTVTTYFRWCQLWGLHNGRRHYDNYYDDDYNNDYYDNDDADDCKNDYDDDDDGRGVGKGLKKSMYRCEIWRKFF